MHEGSGDTSHKNLGRLALGGLKRKIDCSRNGTPLKGKQGRDVNAVPSAVQHRPVHFTLDECDVVPLSMGAVIGGELHEPQGRVLVLVAWLDQENVSICQLICLSCCK